MVRVIVYTYSWGLRAYYLLFLGAFVKIDQNGRPGRQETPPSISFDETSRTKSVFLFLCAVFVVVLSWEMVSVRTLRKFLILESWPKLGPRNYAQLKR